MNWMRNENIPFRGAPRLEMKKKHNISCASFLCPVPDEKKRAGEASLGIYFRTQRRVKRVWR